MSSTQPILGLVPIVRRDYYLSTRAAGTFTLDLFSRTLEIRPVCLSPGLGFPLEQEHAVK